MRSIWKTASLSGLMVLVLVQFTNCDVYSDNTLFQEFNSVCKGEECIQENQDFLEIRINSGGDIPVADSVNRFNVGGECNEGGFAHNEINWALYDNMGFVHDSRKVGLSSACKMGRFAAEVILTDPSNPSPSRVGLRNAQGKRVEYRLEIEIRAYDESGNEYKNSLAKRQVFLKPI